MGRLILGAVCVRHCVFIILIMLRVDGSKIKLKHFLDILHASLEFCLSRIRILNQLVVVI